MSNATWTATYDIYAKMDTKEKAVTLIYKAAILQKTGEVCEALFRLSLFQTTHLYTSCAQNWDDVSLTLETAIPTFGLKIPQLEPWTLSTYRPSPPPPFVLVQYASAPTRKRRISAPRSERRKPTSVSQSSCDYEDNDRRASSIDNRDFLVSSKGDINASFSVPGLISIPRDYDARNVTIVELALDASMSWISIPKKEAKAHLTVSFLALTFFLCD